MRSPGKSTDRQKGATFMTLIRITDGDTSQTHTFATGQLMFSEADLLEKEWGLRLSELREDEIGQDLRTLAAFIWLVKVRALAAERGLAFRKAAEEMPAAEFDFNLGALSAEVMDDANPTGGPTSGPKSGTRRATSAKKKTPTARGAAGS